MGVVAEASTLKRKRRDVSGPRASPAEDTNADSDEDADEDSDEDDTSAPTL